MNDVWTDSQILHGIDERCIPFPSDAININTHVWHEMHILCFIFLISIDISKLFCFVYFVKDLLIRSTKVHSRKDFEMIKG